MPSYDILLRQIEQVVGNYSSVGGFKTPKVQDSPIH